MKMQYKLLATASLSTTPLVAYAQVGGPHIIEALYAFGGGAAGGFFGALLACWLCKRIGSQSSADSRNR